MVKLSKERDLDSDLGTLEQHLQKIVLLMDDVESFVSTIFSRYDLAEESRWYFESWLNRITEHSLKFEEELDFFTNSVYDDVKEHNANN